MNIKKKIIAAFCLIVILLSATGLILIQNMERLAKETENIYRHPFAVSNATRNIRIQLLSIQNYLKDILIIHNDEEAGRAKEKIGWSKNEIQKQFKLIEERFLGDKNKVLEAIEAFSEWTNTCGTLIDCKQQGMEAEARRILYSDLTKNGEYLDTSIGYLADFANAKANEFYTKTLDRKKRSLLMFTSLLAIIIIGSLWILYYVVMNHEFAQKEIKRHFHLIDQNIMLATTDREDRILDISNALCRYLGKTRKEMIGKQCHFFIHESQKKMIAHIFRTIETGSMWQGDLKIDFEKGETRWICQTVHPVFNDNYEISSYTHILNDVTDKKALEELSVTDKLTSLYNRRFFDDIIEKEIRVAYRKGSFLTLAIMDIDFFKRYNDHYGHPAGDDVLIQVSGALKKIAKRPNDYLFRVGGEEFAVIFPETDPNHSYLFLEEIRKSIEGLKIAHEYNDVSEYITVSIGARTFQGSKIPNKNQFYIQADQCLYEAKKMRNKVVII